MRQVLVVFAKHTAESTENLSFIRIIGSHLLESGCPILEESGCPVLGLYWTVLGTGCPVLEELTLEAALVIGNNFPDQAYRIRLQGAVYDPRRINNTTGNLNNSSAQRERKKCQVESICYESSDVAALSTLPDTA